MNIGDPMPRYRMPALVNGTFTSSSLGDFQGQWVILNSVFHFSEVEAIFSIVNTLDFILCPQRFSFSFNMIAPSMLPHQRVKNINLTLLVDPLGRLSRTLSLAVPLPAYRCETLIVNPKGHLQCRLIHDINLRMMQTIIDQVQILQQQHSSL